jgi:hypothetical protein
MKPVVVSAILYGLVGAACLTGCADHPGNHQAVRAEQSGSAMPSTLSDPAVKHHEVNAAGSQKTETSRRNPSFVTRKLFLMRCGIWRNGLKTVAKNRLAPLLKSVYG